MITRGNIIKIKFVQDHMLNFVVILLTPDDITHCISVKRLAYGRMSIVPQVIAVFLLVKLSSATDTVPKLNIAQYVDRWYEVNC